MGSISLPIPTDFLIELSMNRNWFRCFIFCPWINHSLNMFLFGIHSLNPWLGLIFNPHKWLHSITILLTALLRWISFNCLTGFIRSRCFLTLIRGFFISILTACQALFILYGGVIMHLLHLLMVIVYSRRCLSNCIIITSILLMSAWYCSDCSWVWTMLIHIVSHSK